MPPAYYDGQKQLRRLIDIVEEHLKGAGRGEERFAFEIDIILSELRVPKADAVLLTPEDERRQREANKRRGRLKLTYGRILVPPTLLIESISIGHDATTRSQAHLVRQGANPQLLALQSLPQIAHLPGARRRRISCRSDRQGQRKTAPFTVSRPRHPIGSNLARSSLSAAALWRIRESFSRYPTTVNTPVTTAARCATPNRDPEWGSDHGRIWDSGWIIFSGVAGRLSPHLGQWPIIFCFRQTRR